jgi:hypothetical protein
MTPPKRPGLAQGFSEDLPGGRSWLTRDEIRFLVQTDVAIERNRTDERLERLQGTQNQMLARMEDGFSRLETRIAMGDVDRQRQHEQGQEQGRQLKEESRDVKRRLGKVEDSTLDFRQAREQIRFMGKVFGFVQATRWIGGLAKKPVFWTIVGTLAASGGLGTALQLWWYHTHPNPHPVVIVRQITTDQPATPTSIPVPSIPLVPTSPSPLPTPNSSVQTTQPNREKVVGK